MTRAKKKRQTKTKPENPSKTETEVKPEVKPEIKSEEIKFSILDHKVISELSKIINNCTEFIDHAINFILSQDGFHILTFDTGRFMLIDITIKPAFFDSFDFTKEYIISTDLHQFNKVLKRHKTGDTLTFNLNTYLNDISFSFVNKDSNLERLYVLPLVAYEYDEPTVNINDLTFDSQYTLVAKTLSETFDDLKLINDVVMFETIPNALQIHAQKDRNSAKITLNHNSLNVVEHSSEPNTRATYPIDYLKPATALHSLFDHVKLSFSTDNPLKINYSTEYIDINYLIAPSVPDVETAEEEEAEEEEAEEDDTTEWQTETTEEEE